jgi:hypothetical protein
LQASCCVTSRRPFANSSPPAVAVPDLRHAGQDVLGASQPGEVTLAGQVIQLGELAWRQAAEHTRMYGRRGREPDAAEARAIAALPDRSTYSASRPADFVARREGLLDDPDPVIGFGLEFQDNAAVADGLGLENYVALPSAMHVGDRVT